MSSCTLTDGVTTIITTLSSYIQSANNNPSSALLPPASVANDVSTNGDVSNDDDMPSQRYKNHATVHKVSSDVISSDLNTSHVTTTLLNNDTNISNNDIDSSTRVDIENDVSACDVMCAVDIKKYVSACNVMCPVVNLLSRYVIDSSDSAAPTDEPADGGRSDIAPGGMTLIIEVACGPNVGRLHVDRLLQGSRGACILVVHDPNASSWLTPNEFQYVSGRETAKDWKRSIKHHGKSLKVLLAKGTLSFDTPAICRCFNCAVVSILHNIHYTVYMHFR